MAGITGKAHLFTILVATLCLAGSLWGCSSTSTVDVVPEAAPIVAASTLPTDMSQQDTPPSWWTHVEREATESQLGKTLYLVVVTYASPESFAQSILMDAIGQSGDPHEYFVIRPADGFELIDVVMHVPEGLEHMVEPPSTFELGDSFYLAFEAYESREDAEIGLARAEAEDISHARRLPFLAEVKVKTDRPFPVR